MKLDYKDSLDLLKIGDMEEHSFSIVTNPKMFEILSNKLYSNKILAPIRELSTNAIDSHIDAGKSDIPIKVHLPSINDLIFKVEDEGTGLSEEQVITLYSVYGKSSRDQSNEFAGCLGLGSKSPFAYSKTFQVVSTYNKRRSFYNVLLDNGIPKIIKLHTEDNVDYPNGFAVEFKVNSDDVENFRKEAASFYQNFAIKPNFVSFEPTFDETKEEISYGKYKLIEIMKQNYCTEHLFVVMGNVTYGLNKSILYSHFPLETRDWIRNKDFLYLYLPIGEVTFNVARELIEINDENYNAMAKAIVYLHKKEKEKKLKFIKNEKIDLRERLKVLKKAHNSQLFEQSHNEFVALQNKYCFETTEKKSLLTKCEYVGYGNSSIKTIKEMNCISYQDYCDDNIKFYFYPKRSYEFKNLILLGDKYKKVIIHNSKLRDEIVKLFGVKVYDLGVEKKNVSIYPLRSDGTLQKRGLLSNVKQKDIDDENIFYVVLTNRKLSNLFELQIQRSYRELRRKVELTLVAIPQSQEVTIIRETKWKRLESYLQENVISKEKEFQKFIAKNSNSNFYYNSSINEKIMEVINVILKNHDLSKFKEFKQLKKCLKIHRQENSLEKNIEELPKKEKLDTLLAFVLLQSKIRQEGRERFYEIENFMETKFPLIYHSLYRLDWKTYINVHKEDIKLYVGQKLKGMNYE